MLASFLSSAIAVRLYLPYTLKVGYLDLLK